MNCALRTCVYAAHTVFFIFSQGFVSFAKGDKGHSIVVNNGTFPRPASSDEFQWNEHSKLTWNDFRGPVKAATEESAAAMHCGIGFTTTTGSPGGKLQITVYNTFYTNRSWVRPDTKIPELLNHEQGHFDLCEIYTRKLRRQMSNFNFDVVDVRSVLMSIYTKFQDEYESRQQAYELETVHGTNIVVQKRWQDMITKKLSVGI